MPNISLVSSVFILLRDGLIIHLRCCIRLHYICLLYILSEVKPAEGFQAQEATLNDAFLLPANQIYCKSQYIANLKLLQIQIYWKIQI